MASTLDEFKNMLRLLMLLSSASPRLKSATYTHHKDYSLLSTNTSVLFLHEKKKQTFSVS